jgi:hypothetical protein
MLVQRCRQTIQAGVTLFAAQIAVWLNQAFASLHPGLFVFDFPAQQS